MSEWAQMDDHTWQLAVRSGMLVPGRIYASKSLMIEAQSDRASSQVENVAHLPGIVEASFAMPDIHWGYGFPIGGVAATDVAAGGVVSPGGVGFDICCGVRLLASNVTEPDWQAKRQAVMDELDMCIPRGLGKGAIADASLARDVLEQGAAAALSSGYGSTRDLDRCEEGGTSPGAASDTISVKALQRGADQLGSLGAGNHFLEVQLVEDIYDTQAAEVFGLAERTIVVMIHCGSRGLGHQTCTDHVRTMGAAMARHDITVPDRQLACVPVHSPEGERYLAAMAASANFAWANRHILAHQARQAFTATYGSDGDLRLVWDVAHNLAKLEEHIIDGTSRLLCVHRKGATRAFGPGHPDLPQDLRPVGQPVLIPGSMGTASWVLRGVTGNPAFASAAHGAGRLMSRKKAKGRASGREVRRALEDQDIAVRPGSVRLLSEEAPYAYKDVDEVARVCEAAGLAAPVARLVPLGVVKG